MSTKDKLFAKKELIGKTSEISLDRINKIIKNNINDLKYYNKLLDISKLKKGDFVKYVNLNKYADGNTYKLNYGGKIIGIKKKNDGDYRLTIKSNLPYKWYVLFSRVAMFYKTKPTKEIQRKEWQEWKSTMKRDNPDEYNKWLVEKKLKDSIRKHDPKLYREIYNKRRKSKKKI
jgi:hypothetical protein